MTYGAFDKPIEDGNKDRWVTDLAQEIWNDKRLTREDIRELILLLIYFSGGREEDPRLKESRRS